MNFFEFWPKLSDSAKFRNSSFRNSELAVNFVFLDKSYEGTSKLRNHPKIDAFGQAESKTAGAVAKVPAGDARAIGSHSLGH